MAAVKKGVSHAMYTSDSFMSCTNNAPHSPIPAVVVVGVVVAVDVVVIVAVVASTHSVKRNRDYDQGEG